MDLSSNILSVVNAYKDIHFVVLFGSQAEGNATEQSDIDLAVASNGGPLSLTVMQSLQEELYLATGHMVDLIDLLSTEGPVLHEALSRGKILKGEGSPAHSQSALHMIWWQDDFAPLFRQSALAVIQQAFP